MTGTAEAMIESSLSETEITRIRGEFPVLSRSVHGKPLVYLDNGATTQKPWPVINTLTEFYSQHYGTVRRGVYRLSEEATSLHDKARQKVADFVNAHNPSEIIFTRGTTESINLVAHSYGRAFLTAGDEIIISAIEHHANIVPWQQVCEYTGAVLKVIPVNDAGELIMDEYDKLLTDRTRIVAVNYVSNALGTVNPVKDIIEKAHHAGAVVLIDGAQSAPHLPVDVQALDCDFYAFSSHKIYGPTGIGVLYAKRELLDKMPPYQTGGDMIHSVTFEKTTFAKPPNKFEAGTPAIAEAIGLGAAIDYVSAIGLEAIAAHEADLLTYATERVQAIPQVRIIGTAREKASILSFVITGAHPHDIGTILDREGVAIRAGHHCAQPVMERFGVPATARASFAVYNNRQDVDALVSGIHKVIEVFG